MLAALLVSTPLTPNEAAESDRPSAAASHASMLLNAETISLEDALKELEHKNPTLAEMRGRTDEARALTRQALAALIPTIAAQVDSVRNNSGAIIGPFPNIAGFPPDLAGRTIYIQPLHSNTVQASIRVPLVEPSSWFDVASARDSQHSQEALEKASQSALRASFAQAAYASRAAEELVSASEAALKDAVELRDSSRRAVKAGTGARLDELRAETERVRRESDLVQARANLSQSRLALGVLLGRDRPVRVAVPESVPALANEDDSDALERAALLDRPELAAQRAQIEAALAQERSAWALLAPQISASGAILDSDSPFPTGLKNAWKVSLDLIWPLYDGGFRYGKRRQALARLDEARASDEAERLAIVQEVKDGLRDVGVARERLVLAESQRSVAADAAATARRGYEAGVSSSLDVIDANDRLFQADVGLADARARIAQAAVALERAIGR